MTIRPVERYKGYDIYFDDRSEITGDTPRWLIDTGYSIITLDVSRSLDEIKKWLDEKVYMEVKK